MGKWARPVSPAVVIVVLPLVGAATAFCLTSAVLWSQPDAAVWRTSWRAAALAVVYAAVIGAPAAHWAIASGRRGIFQWMGFGAAAGLLLVLAPLAGSFIGALVRGEMVIFRLTWGVVVRFILDAFGLADLRRGSRDLLLIETLPVVCGAVTGALFWIFVVRPR
jgi:hypothetical protein